ncbi:cyclin-dependent kinase 6-like [Pollicipes pollicipes]|uniref:cyclin-dependent kinase 6-like n=1 Tax=Pollicipes pollicipes TaxID=41117 RepID=UPI0018851985|nr:cyclin-dependent kinase 6-like [Pollicipes pollicipes]
MAGRERSTDPAAGFVCPGTEFLRQATNYEEIGMIGNGAYGTVFKARDLRNEGQMVALKKIRVRLSDEGVPMSTLREIATLRQLEKSEHPNIVRLLDICHGQRSEQGNQLILVLVFEHVDQDLAAYLEKCPAPGLSPAVIKNMLYQILAGVDFLHSNRIVHRDLKPQNILVTNSGDIKITDFGLARIYDYQMTLTNVVVTLWYRAPEVLLQSSYATPVDIWSVGCIFAELWRRTALFCGNNDAGQLAQILNIMGTPPESDWPENVAVLWSSFHHRDGILDKVVPEIDELGKDLLQRMLSFSASRRITAAEALLHPYFDDERMAVSSPAAALSCSSANDSGTSNASST